MTKKLLSVLLLLVGVVQGAMAQEPYAVLSDDNTVLTFYYDTKKAERGGMSVGPFGYDYNTYQITPSWYPQRESITTVVFDDSFADCTSLTSTAYWFYRCSKLTKFTDIENLKTDNVTDMSYMFYYCSSLTSLDVSGFKTDNVTSMSGMFYNCESLTRLDVSGFETGNVTDMSGMFSYCYILTRLDVSGFETGNVTNMGGMFSYCYSLTRLDVSNFDTKNVISMYEMFKECYSLTSLDVSNFDTQNVMYMDYMFDGCFSLENIFCNDAWSCSSSNRMFDGCSKLPGYDSNNINNIFYAKPSLSGGYFTAQIVYGVLSNNGMTVTFYYDDKIATRDGQVVEICNMELLNAYGQNPYYTVTTAVFDVSFANYRPTSTDYWFWGCYYLTYIQGIENLDTRKVTNMSCMFNRCLNLTSLDVSNFDTGNVTSMYCMFYGCRGLTSLDVSNFDTGNVTDMSGMFCGCESLTSLDVSNFDTGNVTDMSSMFNGCSGLKNIFCNDAWSCSNSNELFFGCFNLQGYSYGKENADYAKPIADGGYFTAKTEKASKVGDDYWWTYYTDVRNVKADDNTTVYTAKLNADGTKVELNEVTDKIVPRGQAVILKSAVGEPVLYTSMGKYSGNFPANDLRGVQKEISWYEISWYEILGQGTVYTLAAEANGLGFYRYMGYKLAARKAFLVKEGNGARYIGIDGSEATAITDVAAESAAESTVYDLQGRRVSEPQKGLYIVNGKKIVKR